MEESENRKSRNLNCDNQHNANKLHSKYYGNNESRKLQDRGAKELDFI
jgi:hypothetical protein